jgi:hypothetical protein
MQCSKTDPCRVGSRREFANPALITAFAWSAGPNGFAFSANQDAVMWKAVAAVLGVSIPVQIYLGTRTWAALTIESRRAGRWRSLAVLV